MGAIRNIERFDPETIGWINELAEAEPEMSRRELARRVCERLAWQAPNGSLQTMSCYMALRKLEKYGAIDLPEARPCIPAAKQDGVGFSAPYDRPPLECGREALGAIRLVRINGDRKRLAEWRHMMASWHPLGGGRLCGAQIRYIIEAEHGGVLGGMAFSSAAWRLRARDRWIGWEDATRAERLGLVVNNSRFLILPQVRVPNLASEILGLAARILPRDWAELYGLTPVLLETFVDPAHYRGTCYRAANWIPVGRTTGRGRNDTGDMTAPKDVYLLPLRPDFRDVLGGKESPGPADWAEEEFQHVDLGDKRLYKRLLRLARDFFTDLRAGIPEVCGSWSATNAAYRFFNHPAVSMQNLLFSHYQATRERIRNHKGVILAVQDTTSLNYGTNKAAAEGLGPIDKHGTKGILVHDTMVFTDEGVPLGLLDVQAWVRKQDADKVSESDKWFQSFQAARQVAEEFPRKLVVSVGDREADIYELFSLATPGDTGAQLLVRAYHDRKLHGEDVPLWDHMKQRDPAGYIEIDAPARGGAPKRKARLEIRFDQVDLAPPQGKKSLGPIRVWAVLVSENPKPKKGGLEWRLLTTVPVESFEDACERTAWYAKRWGIEVYHRILKSGCRIEKRYLETRDRITSCLAIDMVVGWRTYFLTIQGRAAPDLPCTVLLEDAEWKALTAYTSGTGVPAAEPPSLGTAMELIARLGGYLPRKNSPPGPETIWRGLHDLALITKSYQVFANAHAPP